jgi:hypothetical protein
VEALQQAVGPAMCSNLADWLEDEVSEVDLAKKPGAPPMLESFLQRKYALTPLLWGSQPEVVISPLLVKNKVNSYVQTITLLMG